MSITDRGRTFGELFREQRVAAGLTQAALAELAGISSRGLQDIERGVSLPHRGTLLRVLRVLALSPEDENVLAAAAAPPLRPRKLRASRASEHAVATSSHWNNLPFQLTS